MFGHFRTGEEIGIILWTDAKMAINYGDKIMMMMMKNNSAKFKAKPPLLLLFHSTGDVRAPRIPSIPLLTLAAAAAVQRGFGGAVDLSNKFSRGEGGIGHGCRCCKEGLIAALSLPAVQARRRRLACCPLCAPQGRYID
jgi:hypothetical protein